MRRLRLGALAFVVPGMLIAAWGCKPAQSNLATTTVTELPNKGIGIGASEYDYIMPLNLNLDSDAPLISPCIAVDPAKLALSGTRYGQIDQIMQKSYSYDWLEANLEAQANIEARVLGVSVASAKVSTKYRAANINTKLSFSFNTDYVIEKGTLHGSDFMAADRVKNLVNEINSLSLALRQTPGDEATRRKLSLKHVEFFIQCGDRFVSQVSLGSRFSGAVRVHFKENRQLLDFMVKAEAKIGGIKKKQSESQSYDRSLTDSVVETAFLQSGGSQDRFTAFQKTLGGDTPTSAGSKRVRCFISSFKFEETDDFKQKISKELERCYTTWSMVNQYLAGDYYDQIANATYQDLTAMRQYYQTYTSAGILQEDIVLPEDVKKILAVINEMLKILSKLNLLGENTDQSSERTALAVQFNEQWQPVSDLYKKSQTMIEADKVALKAAINECLGRLKKGEFSACNLKSIDFSKYKDLQFITEDI